MEQPTLINRSSAPVCHPATAIATPLHILAEVQITDRVAFATRAFATPIFVASATPIFVASATPYFRISAPQTAATPEILF